MPYKISTMKKIYQLGGVALIALFIIACNDTSGSKKDEPLETKKKELQKLKTEQATLNDKIKKLEDELAKEDPSLAVKPKLVSITTIAKSNFTHYIDLQGRVATENIYRVAPRGMGGQVKEVYVKEGDQVRKGQLLIKLDDGVMLQNLKQLETQLDFAKNIFNRQKNLWDQGIGTEVQYLTAKNNVENIEKQISSVKEQWSTSNVYSEVSGVVETVTIHPGETFNGLPTATITIVNPGSLKAVVDVPENYLEKVKKGTPVVIEVPDIQAKFNSNISLVSQLINANSRGFMAEAKIPSAANLKPNQIALIKIQDYSHSSALVIPITTLQSDENGKYVYVLELENGKKIARKKQVSIGEVYGDQIEVRAGLKEGDQLISQGFQSIYDGQLVTTEVK